MVFLIWLIPFVVSVIIFPLKENMRPLFESIMPLVISLITIVLSFNYIKNLRADFVKEGIIIGLAWLIITLVLDIFLFIPESPIPMEFFE